MHSLHKLITIKARIVLCLPEIMFHLQKYQQILLSFSLNVLIASL
jgi:hypothetical protein